MELSYFPKRMIIALGLIALAFVPLSLDKELRTQASSICQNAALTVGPAQAPSLQKLLDQAPSGAVIFLKAGTYPTNLFIVKSLTLCGEGPQQTILEGFLGGPVVSIFNHESTIDVTLQDLSLTKGKGNFSNGSGLDLSQISVDNLARVNLKNIKISANESFGIVAPYMADQSQLTLEHVEISDNKLAGLLIGSRSAVNVKLQDILVSNNGSGLSGLCSGIMGGSANLTLKGVRLIGNKCEGLSLGGNTRVTAVNLQISNNTIGIQLFGTTQASFTGVRIDGNTAWGILLTRSAQLDLQQATVSHNGQHGVLLVADSKMKLTGSLLEGNGTDPVCKKTDTGEEEAICNGVLVQNQAQLSIKDSTIRENTDWGVAAVLSQCGYMDEVNRFTGTVAFEGHNVIEGNNKSGNQKGMGNPGSHPFQNLPPGNVCLP